MKQVFCILAIVGMGFLWNTQIFAEEKNRKTLELSGYVSTLFGFQHDDRNATPTAQGGLGRFRGNAEPNRDTFNFYIDNIALNIDAHFSEAIHLRADLQFGNMAAGSSPFELEQGYIGFTLPLGKGVQTQIGHFNAPIGFENSADISQNAVLSLAPISGPTMTNVTGILFSYDFTDKVSHSFYLFNNMRDDFTDDSIIPGIANRLEYHWGKEGATRHIAYNFAASPDRPNENRHWRIIHDIDFSLQLTPQFSLGGEGLYIRDHAAPPETINDIIYGGMLTLHYDFSKNLYGFLRYNFLRDRGPTHEALGADADIHSNSIGLGYQITENALFKFEYRLDILKPVAMPSTLSHSIANEFVYHF